MKFSFKTGIYAAYITAAVFPAHAWPAEELVITGDSVLGVVRIVNMDRGTIVRDISALEIASEECEGEDGKLNCYVLAAHHSTDSAKEHDYVTFGAFTAGDANGVVQRVELLSDRSVSTVFRLKRLDFSGVSSNSQCLTPCSNDVGCRLDYPHEILYTNDDPDNQRVEMAITEMGSMRTNGHSGRIVGVSFDYSGDNQCGKVEWVLDDSIAASDGVWPTYAHANGIQIIENTQGKFLLTNMLSQDPTVQRGGGRIMLWEFPAQSSELFKRLWLYPPDDPNTGVGEDSGRYTNAGHLALIAQDQYNDGRWFMTYAHSLSLSPTWNAGAGGTFGYAEFFNGDLRTPPKYIADYALPKQFQPLTFTRQLQIFPDGRILALDGGSYTPETREHKPQIYWFSSFEVPAATTDKVGNFLPRQRTLNLKEIPAAAVLQETQCGFKDLFKAEAMPALSLGSVLARESEESTASCPN